MKGSSSENFRVLPTPQPAPLSIPPPLHSPSTPPSLPFSLPASPDLLWHSTFSIQLSALFLTPFFPSSNFLFSIFQDNHDVFRSYWGCPLPARALSSSHLIMDTVNYHFRIFSKHGPHIRLTGHVPARPPLVKHSFHTQLGGVHLPSHRTKLPQAVLPFSGQQIECEKVLEAI